MAGDLGAGHVLGRYELLMPIASGGMAMVWAARLTGTRGFQKIVAIKTMLPKLSEDEQFEQMFLDEASLACQIRHPHVVEILDLGEQEGVLYLVMEWIEGVPLNQLMKVAKKEGGIPNPVAVRIVMQACGGLHAAHELRNEEGDLVGLVHRDVSPQNILVTYDGVSKVVDFGVAKATALGDGATVAGQIKGKVGYMAPEQVKGEPIDRRVDVFALGIVLYALTTGKHPFRRENEAATMYNICAPQPVMAPRKFLPHYPEKLQEVLLKALEKDPAQRYQTANDLLKALDLALAPELRASDEDVAAYVRKLMGGRREEQKRALAQAIERTQLMAQSGSSLRRLIDQPPPFPVQQPISQVSYTATGPADSFHNTNGESELSSGHLDSTFEVGRGPGRRIRMVGLAAMVLMLGLAIAVFASVRTSKHISAASPPLPARQPEPLATNEERPSDQPAPVASDQPAASDGDSDKALEGTGQPSGTTDADKQAVTVKAGRAKQTRTPTRTTPPTEKATQTQPVASEPKKASADWNKQNPGF
jgi:serine/threonine-protein kinase